jgi:hypothetical protein
MSVKVELVNARTGISTLISDTGAQLVAQMPLTARGVDRTTVASHRAVFELMTRKDTGASDQVVDGSVNPIEFCVSSDSGYTKWITGFRMVIVGTNLDVTSNQLRRYSANAAGLTTGIDIKVFQGGENTSLVASPVQTIADYFPYLDRYENRPGAYSASEDLLTIDFVFQSPVVLAQGGTSRGDDRVLVCIQDDMTAALNSTNAEQFTIAFGFKEAVQLA